MGKSFRKHNDDWDNDYIPLERFRKRRDDRLKKQQEHDSALRPSIEDEEKEE